MILKILLLSTLSSIFIDAKISNSDAIDYLSKYGYIRESKGSLMSGPAAISSSNNVLKDTLRRFQLIHGLPVTGILDEITKKKMSSPRCSLPDFRPGGNVASFKAASKWKKKDLTFAVLNENQELRGQTRRIMSEALKHWSDVSGLTFRETHQNSNPDLKIKFGSRHHGDSYPFDGPGGVLAHAFFPEEGQIHFDEDETFTDRKKDGTDLKIIAVHEFGHALGLEHSLEQGAVMNPYYQGYDPNFKLGKDDVHGIQFLYGKPNAYKPTTIRTTPRTTTKRPIITRPPIATTKPHINKYWDFLPCHLEKQAVFLGPDWSTVYAILDDDHGFYKFDLGSRSWKKESLSRVYRGLPSEARGGLIDDKGIIWFFHDIKIYAYRRSQLLPGFPKKIDDFLYPKHPYAAAYKNKKIYLFKNWLLYELDVENLKIKNIHRTSTIFDGLSMHVDASFRYNGYQYFFNNEKMYKFDERLNRMESGYPKLTSDDWFL
ncbi:matrix metallo ase-19, partial [Brachionus plicatilis]